MHAHTRAKTAQALDAKAAVSGEAISQQKVATWVKWAAAGRDAGQHANGRVQLRAGKATSLEGGLDEHAFDLDLDLVKDLHVCMRAFGCTMCGCPRTSTTKRGQRGESPSDRRDGMGANERLTERDNSHQSAKKSADSAIFCAAWAHFASTPVHTCLSDQQLESAMKARGCGRDRITHVDGEKLFAPELLAAVARSRLLNRRAITCTVVSGDHPKKKFVRYRVISTTAVASLRKL
jgi:hypothetical protein